MAVFLDDLNHRWSINLTVGLILDIKDKADIDLDNLMRKPEELSELLMASPRKLVELLYVACEQQCIKEKVDPANFGRLFSRATIDRATNALLEALVDFYPRSAAGSAMRESLPALIEKMDRELADKAKKYMTEKLLNTPIG